MKRGEIVKNFEDFKAFVSSNGDKIHSSIHQKVMSATEKQSFTDIAEEHEFIRRAWVEIGVMEMLEHYHNWLNQD